MRSTNFSIAALLMAIGAGCAVGPPYQPPKAQAPAAFAELNSKFSTNEMVAEWWHQFNDPELDKLISDTLKSNLDLQVASMRIRESRYQRNIAAADLFPTLNADSSFVHSRGSQNVVLPIGGAGGSSSGSGGAGGSSGAVASPRRADASSQNQPQGDGSDTSQNSPGVQPSPFGQGGLPGATTDLYQVGFDATWEIDVFGGKRRRIEAAGDDLDAARESQRDLQVSLAAEVARDYIELRSSQDRLRIAHENFDAQKEVLDLTRAKRAAGLTTDLDVLQASAQISETASTIPPLEADCRRLVHALSILMAKQPNDLSAELDQSQPVPPNPPEVPVGLPSELIQRRADIRVAERQIAAANARIGVAEADWFPKFALVGSTGLDSSSPQNLFDWESHYFLISPTVTWRIFDAGRIASNVRLQKTIKEESVLQYRSTILKAFQEVEDALVMYATEQARRNHLADRLNVDKQALALARSQYDTGLTDFLVVLDAERNVYSAQDDYAKSDMAVSTDLVALYKSLGGGWK